MSERFHDAEKIAPGFRSHGKIDSDLPPFLYAESIQNKSFDGKWFKLEKKNVTFDLGDCTMNQPILITYTYVCVCIQGTRFLPQSTASTRMLEDG